MKMKVTCFTLTALFGALGHLSAQDRDKKPDLDSVKKRIEGAVERGDLTRDQANQKYAELKKKMAYRKDGGDKKPDMDGIKKRIEGAVKSGDLTRDQANKKYAEMKKKMAYKKVGPPQMYRKDAPTGKPGHGMPPGPQSLKRLLGEMMKHGKMDEKTAAHIFGAAFGDDPRPQGQGPRPQGPVHGPGPRPNNGPMGMMQEMRKTIEAAKRELAQIRQMRMEMERARQFEEIERAKHHLEMERRELMEHREHLEREHHERREHMEREHDEHREHMERERDEHREHMEREEMERDEKRREELKREHMEMRRRAAPRPEVEERKPQVERERPPVRRGAPQLVRPREKTERER